MSFFILLLIVLALRGLNSYFKGSRKEKSYVTNNEIIDKSLLLTYYDVLGLNYGQSINPEIICKAFHKQLELSSDDRLRGYKPTYSLKELQAAKAYLIDFCNYTGTWN